MRIVGIISQDLAITTEIAKIDKYNASCDMSMYAHYILRDEIEWNGNTAPRKALYLIQT